MVVWIIKVIEARPPAGEGFILIMGGFGSHTMTVDSLEQLWEARIYCVGMSPHTGSEAQPLDKVVFFPVKHLSHDAMDDWVLDRYEERDRTVTYTIWDLPAFMEESIIKGGTMVNVVNGFAECGIYPLEFEWTSKPHNQKKLRVSDPLKGSLLRRLMVTGQSTWRCTLECIAVWLQLGCGHKAV